MRIFLHEVADWLINKHQNQLRNICLVFPNRRSGVFFQYYFNNIIRQQQLKHPLWMPKILTINEFITDFSDLRIAEPMELLGQLYKIYLKKSKAVESFDSFYAWGEMMLSDFNDVDKYLVNPDAVFGNVRSLKEMESHFSYLTHEQKEVIQRFFSNFESIDKSELKERFLKIWQVLLEIYTTFREQLNQEGFGYEGMVYKDALNRIEIANDFSFTKVYFAGFNAITPAEAEIFKLFNNRKLAGFFWDYDAYYLHNEQMEAGFFQRKYTKEFPPCEGFHLPSELIATKKDIQVISVPTDHGQVFKAAQILQQTPKEELEQTALVLSDEQLLMPVLNQIPEAVTQVNVTMGYGIRESLMAQWIDLLINLQLNSRESKVGEISFYYKNVMEILNHPFVQQTVISDASKWLETIKKENLYQVEGAELQDNPLFQILFIKVDSIPIFENYTKQTLSFLNRHLWSNQDLTSEKILDREFGYFIYTRMNVLSEQITQQQIDLQLPTYFRLLRRLIKTIRVPFEGEPIGGLQLMGFLETRNLDFKHLIILSVNEGILPKGSQSASFIPYGLRQGFGLPTRDLHDAMYAYYFYRLLQRAENVWLLYNSSSGGLTTGEKSRFIYQLQYDSNFEVKTANLVQTIDVVSGTQISIKKEGKVGVKLRAYLDEKNKLKLSPSALSTYLTCSLRYYFKAIAGIHEPDEVEEQVDARLFGSIFHRVAEFCYGNFMNEKKLVTEAEIVQLQKNERQMDEWIRQSFQEVLRGEKSKRIFHVDGKNQIVFQVIKKYLLRMLAIDKKAAPFQIIGLEKDILMPVSFNYNGAAAQVMVGGQIDRLDETVNALRIVDYKSGADELYFQSLEAVFDTEKISKVKAVFQTFIYSLAVAKNYPGYPVVVPAVYQLKKFFTDDVDFSVRSADPRYASGNFKDVEAFVEGQLKLLLEELFDESIPFSQTDDLKRCGYCPYKMICGR